MKSLKNQFLGNLILLSLAVLSLVPSAHAARWTKNHYLFQAPFRHAVVTLLALAGRLDEANPAYDPSCTTYGDLPLELNLAAFEYLSTNYTYENFSVVQPGDLGVPTVFSDLGPMHFVNNLIWSGVAPSSMNHRDAEQFCHAQGGRLPTKEEYEALAISMGRPRTYNPDLLPGTRGNRIWTGSVLPNNADYTFSFNGDYGLVDTYYRDFWNSFRCVRGAQ